MTPVVRTVLGDVAATDLGFVDCHDHVLIAAGLGTRERPELLVDDVAVATEELTELRAAGGGTIVDAMPPDTGRDAAGLVAVSRASGVHVVAVTGFHTERYYEPVHWSGRYAVETVAQLLADEITVGMDRHEYSGPAVERLDARAGLVKVATGLSGLTPAARLRFEAVAACSLGTGAPVLTHTEHGALALEQVEELASHGLPAERVLLSHIDRTHDRGFHRELAASGAYLVYDGPSRSAHHAPEDVADLIQVAVEQGAAERVLLGLDLAVRTSRTGYGGKPGFSFLLTVFLPLLAARGFTAEHLRLFGWANPARALALREAA